MRTKKKKTLDFTFTSTVISMGYSPHSVAFCATDYR